VREQIAQPFDGREKLLEPAIGLFFTDLRDLLGDVIGRR